MTGLIPLLPLIKEEVERANKAGADLIERQRKQKEEEGREAERKRLEDLKKAQGTATTPPSTKTQTDKGSAPVAAGASDNRPSQLKTPSILPYFFLSLLSLLLSPFSFFPFLSLSSDHTQVCFAKIRRVDCEIGESQHSNCRIF